jgi:hypothetical protein
MIRRRPISPPEPVPEFLIDRETNDPPNTVTVSFYRSTGLLRFLGPVGTVKIDLYELLCVDRKYIDLMASSLNEPQEEPFRKITREPAFLRDGEIDALLDNPYIKQSAALVDDILEKPSPEMVEYIRAHIETKLNDALQQLKTEAQRVIANKRAKVRSLPVKDSKKFAAALVKSEARAIERRLARGEQKAEGRPPKISKTDLSIEIATVAKDLMSKATQQKRKFSEFDHELFSILAKEIHARNPKISASGAGMRKRIIDRNGMKEEWNVLKRQLLSVNPIIDEMIHSRNGQK